MRLCSTSKALGVAVEAQSAIGSNSHCMADPIATRVAGQQRTTRPLLASACSLMCRGHRARSPPRVRSLSKLLPCSCAGAPAHGHCTCSLSQLLPCSSAGAPMRAHLHALALTAPPLLMCRCLRARSPARDRSHSPSLAHLPMHTRRAHTPALLCSHALAGPGPCSRARPTTCAYFLVPSSL